MASKLDISVSILGELTEEVNEEARATAFNIQTELVRTTPVDTGRARGNWFLQVGRPYLFTEEDRRAAEAISEAEREVKKDLDKIEPIYITNNLPYIASLNDGSSSQAPAKFIENAIRYATNGR